MDPFALTVVKIYQLILPVYLIIINLAGFFMMLTDKNRAKKDRTRIRESSLFWVAVFGGSIGSIAGMYLFRHKTKHKSFVIGMPVILILQLAAAVALYLFTR